MISELDADAVDTVIDELADVLHACVNAGASVGFVTPFSHDDARAFWLGIKTLVARGERTLLVARHDGRVMGTVQVVLAMPGNGLHRAELAKLLVHPHARRAGLGRALIAMAEEVACRHGRRLLVLDTRRFDDGERLYRAAGYVTAGIIPEYALSSEGVLDDTVVMFKRLARHSSI